jgi:tetratricopeptide (TPR) repeat protein
VDGKLGRVMINPHAHPALILADIVNTVRYCLSQFLVLEIVAAHFFRLAFWLLFSPSILEVSHQLLFLRVNRDDRLVSLLEFSALPVEVFELSIAVLMRRAFLLQQEFQRAYSAFKSALELDPGRDDARFEGAYAKAASTPVRMQLAVLYERQGRPEDAIRMYSELQGQMNREPDILNNMAYLYAGYSTDEAALAKAADLVLRALAMQPENPNFLDTAAWVAYKQGDLNSAWSYILQIDPSLSVEGVHNLHAALILEGLGHKEPVMEYLRKALQQKMDQKSRDKALALKKEWEGAGG